MNPEETYQMKLKKLREGNFSSRDIKAEIDRMRERIEGLELCQSDATRRLAKTIKSFLPQMEELLKSKQERS